MKREPKGLKAHYVTARAVASSTSGGPGSSAMDTKPCKGVTRVTQSPSDIEFTQFVPPLQGERIFWQSIPGPSARAITLQAFSPLQKPIVEPMGDEERDFPL
jgi:hypothetical protein